MIQANEAAFRNEGRLLRFAFFEKLSGNNRYPRTLHVIFHLPNRDPPAWRVVLHTTGVALMLPATPERRTTLRQVHFVTCYP